MVLFISTEPFRRRVPLAAALLGLLTSGCYSAGSGDDDDDDEDNGVSAQCVDAPREIGATALRRMTQSQYDHTIEDLLGIQANASAVFTPDERVGPFKSNAVAPVVALQVEHYMDVAEEVAELVVADLPGHLPCDPAAAGEDSCADQWLREIMPRAYRRPVTEAELSRITEVYQGARENGDDFATGVGVMMQTLLQSPLFLYHVEEGEAGGQGGPRRLTGHELASRLSYFLWDSMPDDALFDAAAAGELSTDAGIQAQVDRMLADPKAERAVSSFHLQWLGVDEIERLEKSPEVYPAFDAALAEAMKEDTSRFVNWVIGQGDGRLQTLLTGAFTLSDNPELLALYGVQAPADHTPGTPLALPADERAGLLTMPSVMAEHAHANQTSPIHRGQLVRENFLCQPLLPPPPGVDDVAPDPKPGATTRERFEEHTTNPECAGCHSLIDGLGFGLENYDGIGAFRTLDGDLPVDASGEVIGTEDINGTFEGAIELAGRLSQSEDVRVCVVRQWFRYSLGRMEDNEDICATERLAARFADADYDVRTLIHEIVVSDAFRYRRISEDSTALPED